MRTKSINYNTAEHAFPLTLLPPRKSKGMVLQSRLPPSLVYLITLSCPRHHAVTWYRAMHTRTQATKQAHDLISKQPASPFMHVTSVAMKLTELLLAVQIGPAQGPRSRKVPPGRQVSPLAGDSPQNLHVQLNMVNEQTTSNLTTQPPLGTPLGPLSRPRHQL
jgi:hypothetical protein